MRFLMLSLVAILVSSQQQKPKTPPATFAVRIWDGSDTIYSYARGKQYIVGLPRKPTGPRWEKRSLHPPLPAGSAISRAVNTAKQLLKDEENYAWGLTGAELTPWESKDGYWYWTVSFEQNIVAGGSSGIPPHLRLMVLMDGTVVKPQQKKWPRDN